MKSALMRLGVLLVLAGLALPFLADLAMSRGLNHDEHQHIAAGMLWAREGLMPYRDYPHFHTPYLAFVYGELFRWTAHPLLVARAFSALCATGIVALVGWVAFAEFRRAGAAWRAALGAVALCLLSAVFTHTTGRAWNQEPALLLVLLAFVAHLRGLHSLVRRQRTAPRAGHRFPHHARAAHRAVRARDAVVGGGAPARGRSRIQHGAARGTRGSFRHVPGRAGGVPVWKLRVCEGEHHLPLRHR